MTSPMYQELLACRADAAQRQGEQVVQDFVLPPNFSGFSGHFPGFPIVPAVVQVLLAQLTARENGLSADTMVALERAKFHRQLRPDERISVQCCRKQVRGKCVIDAQLKVVDELASAFWIVVPEVGEVHG